MQMPDIAAGLQDWPAPAETADEFRVAEVPSAAIDYYRGLKAQRIRAERAKRNLRAVRFVGAALAKRRNSVALREAGYHRL